jgi:hypothetical protein
MERRTNEMKSIESSARRLIDLVERANPAADVRLTP